MIVNTINISAECLCIHSLRTCTVFGHRTLYCPYVDRVVSGTSREHRLKIWSTVDARSRAGWQGSTRSRQALPDRRFRPRIMNRFSKPYPAATTTAAAADSCRLGWAAGICTLDRHSAARHAVIAETDSLSSSPLRHVDQHPLPAEADRRRSPHVVPHEHALRWVRETVRDTNVLFVCAMQIWEWDGGFTPTRRRHAWTARAGWRGPRQEPAGDRQTTCRATCVHVHL